MHQFEIHHPYHLPHWRENKLSPLFISAALRSFAIGLVGIFVPVYIFKISVTQFPQFEFLGGLLVVLLFFLSQTFLTVLVSYPGAFILQRISFSAAMFIGNALQVLGHIALLLAEHDWRFMIPAVLFLGLHIPFYWIPYHLMFVEQSNRDHGGKDFSRLQVFSKLATALGPFIGGTIITFLGFPLLFLTAVVILVISSWPVFKIKKTKDLQLSPWRELLTEVSLRKNRAEMIALNGLGADSTAQQVYWPLFVFLALGSIELLGIVTSAVLVISLFVLYLTGRLVDSHDRRRILKMGSFSNSSVWLMRIFATTVTRVLVFDILQRLFYSFLFVPFEVIFYDRARKRGTLDHIVIREWNLNFGRVMLLILTILLVLLGVSWLAAFVLAALASAITFLMGVDKKVD